ncbi:hypothetical protein F4779DRAFT_642984 [Xylariaceae sp. FL0662B]|nr:hypothetical protein F4779DRAFT_642984 [Xylariaceae sp. FL0662B]
MSSSQKFQYFPRLPVELQLMIWEFYRKQAGIRHYMGVNTKNERLYAAMDTEGNRFVNTYATINAPETRWPRSHPAAGEESQKIRLIGRHFVPDPGDEAKSLVTARHTELWNQRQALFLRIHFDKDLVFLDGGGGSWDRPLSNLNGREWNLLNSRWFFEVRHLAIQVPQRGLAVYAMGQVIAMQYLKSIHLVGYRDPYRAPRTWSQFRKDLLDEYKFLPVEDFIRLHPNRQNIQCQCHKDAEIVNKIAGELRTFLGRSGKVVDVRSVVDPY